MHIVAGSYDLDRETIKPKRVNPDDKEECYVALQAISLKAGLEAMKGNFRRAGKLITNRSTEAEPLQGLEEVQVLCNMAFVQHREGRHHTAVLCYCKALKLASQNKAALIPLVSFS